MFPLLSFWILSGFMQENSAVTHYQLRNSSLCLHVTDPLPYKGGEWSFAAKVIASDDINPNYAEKVFYNPVNLSLCLKELTDADSGVYKVRFKDSKFNVFLQSHTVIVQDRVPRPVITMSVRHSNLSAGSCSIRVNCSIQNEWVSWACDNDSCEASQQSFSRVNISISAHNRTVLCSGSNLVSTNNVSQSMTAVCFSQSIADDTEASLSHFLIAIVLVVFVCLTFMAYGLMRRCFKNNHHQGRTLANPIVQTEPTRARPQPEPTRSASSSSEAEVSYENVDITQLRQTSGLGGQAAPMPHIDTVYSIIEVPGATPSPATGDSSKDGEGHKTTREPPSCRRTVSGEEAERLTHIDTVYSVLQKPNNVKSQLHQQVKGEFSKP